MTDEENSAWANPLRLWGGRQGGPGRQPKRAEPPDFTDRQSTSPPPLDNRCSPGERQNRGFPGWKRVKNVIYDSADKDKRHNGIVVFEDKYERH